MPHTLRTPRTSTMAMTAGTADAQTRTLPSAWTPLEPALSMQEALEALETYKKKDPAKGVLLCLLSLSALR